MQKEIQVVPGVYDVSYLANDSDRFIIPVVNKAGELLSLAIIKIYVDSLTTRARAWESCNFMVSLIGCEKGQYSPAQIAPLFAGCMELQNVALPSCFVEVIAKQNNYEAK